MTKLDKDLEINGTGKTIGDLIPTKEIITVGLDSDILITSNKEYYIGNIPLNLLISKIGNKLTLSDGKIVIGSGISKILISGNILTQGSTAMYGLYIRRNNERVSNAYEIPVNISFSQIALSPKIIDVTEGDTIDLAIYMDSNNVVKNVRGYNGSATYLTVQNIS